MVQWAKAYVRARALSFSLTPLPLGAVEFSVRRLVANGSSEAEVSEETAALIEGDDGLLRVLHHGLVDASPSDNSDVDPATVAVICVVSLAAVGAVVAMVMAKRRRDAAVVAIQSERRMNQAVQSQRDTEFKSLCASSGSGSDCWLTIGVPRTMSSRRSRRVTADGPGAYRLANGNGGGNGTSRRRSSRRSRTCAQLSQRALTRTLLQGARKGTDRRLRHRTTRRRLEA